MHLHISPDMLIGFGHVQINQVLESCDCMLTMEDVYKYVEIWHHNHAVCIYNIIENACEGTPALSTLLPSKLHSDDDYEERIGSEWINFLEDDDLIIMAIENMSLSQLNDDSALGEE